jgi:hypothetical protein
MKKNYFLIIGVVLAVIVLLVLGLVYWQRNNLNYYFARVTRDQTLDYSANNNVPVSSSTEEPTVVPKSGGLIPNNVYTSPQGVSAVITSPNLYVDLSCPVTIKGQISGIWFSEGVFPVKLVDDKGKVIASSTATTKDDWMTTDDVDFSAKLTCIGKCPAAANLVIEKDNPSGMPVNDDKITIPVTFAKSCQ